MKNRLYGRCVSIYIVESGRRESIFLEKTAKERADDGSRSGAAAGGARRANLSANPRGEPRAGSRAKFCVRNARRVAAHRTRRQTDPDQNRQGRFSPRLLTRPTSLFNALASVCRALRRAVPSRVRTEVRGRSTRSLPLPLPLPHPSPPRIG